MLAKWHWLVLLFALGAAAICTAFLMSAPQSDLPQSADNYFQNNETVLREKLALRPNTGRARNIILFIGDGMSIPTIAAARIYGGQKNGRDGASNVLEMEKLPYSALSRTYSHDSLVTDSAPSATSMTAGIKSANGTIGVSQRAVPLDCAKSKGTDVTTIFEMAETAGLATGIISTARITHATPAAAYAHTPGRDWEADSDMPAIAKAQGCKDIAVQLLEWKYGDG
jgi:alkaline phosphatase